MKPIVIYSDRFLKAISWLFIVDGISLFPFVFLRERFKDTEYGKQMLNHETIHFQQAVETLFIGFYLIYLLNFAFNLVKYGDSKIAYYSILFEHEAYDNEADLEYLSKRKRYCWISL